MPQTSNQVVAQHRALDPNDPSSDQQLTLQYGNSAQGATLMQQYPDFAADYQNLIAQQKAALAPTALQEVGRGASAGVSSLESTGFGALALGAKFAGLDKAGNYLAGKAQEAQADAAQNQPSVASISDVHSPSDLGKYLGYQFGHLFPNLAEAGVTGVVGALAGGAAGTVAEPAGGEVVGGAGGFLAGFFEKQAVKSIIRSKLAQYATEVGADEAAPLAQNFLASEAGKAAVTKTAKELGAKYGEHVAQTLNFWAQSAGGTYNKLSQDPNVDPGTAMNVSLLGGLAQAVPAQFLPSFVVNKYFGDNAAVGPYFVRLASNAAKAIPGGAASMSMMELASIASEKYADPATRDQAFDLSQWSKQDIQRLADAGVTGGLAGVIGAPLAAIPRGIPPELKNYTGDLSTPEGQKKAQFLQTLALKDINKTLDFQDVELMRQFDPTTRNAYTAAKVDVQDALKRQQEAATASEKARASLPPDQSDLGALTASLSANPSPLAPRPELSDDDVLAGLHREVTNPLRPVTPQAELNIPVEEREYEPTPLVGPVDPRLAAINDPRIAAMRAAATQQLNPEEQNATQTRTVQTGVQPERPGVNPLGPTPEAGGGNRVQPAAQVPAAAPAVPNAEPITPADQARIEAEGRIFSSDTHRSAWINTRQRQLEYDQTQPHTPERKQARKNLSEALEAPMGGRDAPTKDNPLSVTINHGNPEATTGAQSDLTGAVWASDVNEYGTRLIKTPDGRVSYVKDENLLPEQKAAIDANTQKAATPVKTPVAVDAAQRLQQLATNPNRTPAEQAEYEQRLAASNANNSRAAFEAVNKGKLPTKPVAPKVMWSSAVPENGKALYLSDRQEDAQAYAQGRPVRQYEVTPKNSFNPETSSDKKLVAMFDSLGGIHEAPQNPKFIAALKAAGYDSVVGGERGHGGESHWVVTYDQEHAKPVAPAAKEPWEMTEREYQAKGVGLPQDHPIVKQNSELTTQIRLAGEELLKQSGFWKRNKVGDLETRRSTIGALHEVQAHTIETALRSTKVSKEAKETYRTLVQKQKELGEQADAITSHRNIVEQALREGKPVPQEVLKDYPDLQKKEPVAQSGYIIGVPTIVERSYGVDATVHKWPGNKVTIMGRPDLDAAVYKAKSGWIAYVNGRAFGKAEKGVGNIGFDTPEEAVEHYISTLKPIKPPVDQPVKNPWQMTGDEYFKSEVARGREFATSFQGINEIASEHSMLVRAAARAGEDIPESVRKQYPDVAKIAPVKGPLADDWHKLKSESPPNSLTAVRIGDFYEFFFTDAVQASNAIGEGRGKGLTNRHGIDMWGVAFHSADAAIKKLNDAGFTVAIADNKNKVVEGKPIERGITEVRPATVAKSATVEPVRAENAPTEPKYQVKGQGPQLHTIVERPEPSATERANGEVPVVVRNDRTGATSTVLESDLKAVTPATAEEKAAKGRGRDLDAELRAYKLDPSVFPNKASKIDALRRQAAISLEKRIKSLKIDITDKGKNVLEGVTSIPLFIYNKAVDIVAAAVAAGKHVADAIEDGINWIKANHPGLKFKDDEFREKVNEQNRQIDENDLDFEGSRLAEGGKTARYPAYVELEPGLTEKELAPTLVSGATSESKEGKRYQNTRRLTVVEDARTGKVHLLSTFWELNPNGRGRGIKLADPEKPGKNIRLGDLLAKEHDAEPQYNVIGSLRLKIARTNFDQVFDNRAAYEETIGGPARDRLNTLRAHAATIPTEYGTEGGDKSAGIPGQRVPVTGPKVEGEFTADHAAVLHDMLGDLPKDASRNDVAEEFNTLARSDDEDIRDTVGRMWEAVEREHPDLDDAGVLRELYDRLYETHQAGQAEGPDGFGRVALDNFGRAGDAARDRGVAAANEPYLQPETPAEQPAPPAPETGGGHEEPGGTAGVKFRQVDTPAFKEWFGKSKIVDHGPLVMYHGTHRDFITFDPNAKRTTRIDDFGKAIYFTADPEYAAGVAKFGAAGKGGENIIPVFLRVEKPFVMDLFVEDDNMQNESRQFYSDKTRERLLELSGWTEKERDDIQGGLGEYNDEHFDPVEIGIKPERVTEVMKQDGYDGIVVNRTVHEINSEEDYETSGERKPFHEVGVFDRNQIKSAIGNRGTFDRTNPDITGRQPTQSPQDIQQHHAALLQNIHEAAREGGLNVVTLQRDITGLSGEFARRTGAAYDSASRTVAQVLSDVVGKEDIVTSLHEVGHDVFSRLSPEDQARALRAVAGLSDRVLGVDLSSDPRIRQSNPEGLAPGPLNEERLVEATALRLTDQGFDPQRARGIAASFVRALKDLYLRGAMAVQRALFGDNFTDPSLAVKFFENRVKSFLAGDDRRMSFIDMLGGGRSRPERVASWHDNGRLLFERLNEMGKPEYQHVADDSLSASHLNNLKYTLKPQEDEADVSRQRVGLEERSALFNHAQDHLDKAALHPDIIQVAEEAGSRPVPYLIKTLNLVDPKSQHIELQRDLEANGNTIQFDRAKNINGFSDRSNDGRVSLNAFINDQKLLGKLGNLQGRELDKFQTLAAKSDEVLAEHEALRAQHADWYHQASAIAKSMQQEVRRLFSSISGESKRQGAIEEQLRAMDPEADLKRYAPAFQKLFTGEELKGERITTLLDKLANDPTVDFSKPMKDIREALSANPEYAHLVQNTDSSRALTATLVALAKTNARVMANLELRRLASGEERQQIADKIDTLRQDTKNLFKDFPTLIRTAKIEQRVQQAYSKSLTQVRLIRNRMELARERMAAINVLRPIVAEAHDTLAGKLAIGVDTTFGNGMRYALPLSKEATTADLLRLHAGAKDSLWQIHKLDLDASQTHLTDPATVEQHLHQIAQFLNFREEQYRQGNLDALDTAYQAAKNVFNEVGGNKNFKLNIAPADKVLFGFAVMGNGKAISEAVGSPAARSIETQVNRYTTGMDAMDSEAERIWRKSAQLERPLVNLLPTKMSNPLEYLRENFLNPAKRTIMNATGLAEEYAGNPEGLKKALYNKVMAMLQSDKTRADIMKGREGQWRDGLTALLEQHRAAADYFEARNRAEDALTIMGRPAQAGTNVLDPRLRVLNPVTGKLESGTRKAIPIGPYTFAQKTADLMRRMVNALRNSGWVAEDENGKLTSLAEGEFSKIGAEMDKGDQGDVHGLVDKYFNDDIHGEAVRKNFWGMLAQEDDTSVFQTPKRGDGETSEPANTTLMQKAYDMADGDPIETFRNAYRLHGGEDLYDEQGQVIQNEGTYVQSQLQRLADIAYEAHKIAGDDGVNGSNGSSSVRGMIPAFAINARTIEHLPGAWFDYHSFDQYDTYRMARRIAAQNAFGRNSEGLAKAADTVLKEIGEAKNRLKNAMDRVTSENPNATKKQTVQALKDLFASTQQKANPKLTGEQAAKAGADEYRRLTLLSKRGTTVNNSLNGIVQYFRKDNAPEGSVKLLQRIANFIGTMMTNQPSSAINLVTQMSDVALRYGASGSVIKRAVQGYGMVGSEIAHSLLQAMGIEVSRGSEYDRLYRELGLQPPEMVRNFRDSWQKLENERPAAHFLRAAFDTLGVTLNPKGEEASHVPFRPLQPFTMMGETVDWKITNQVWRLAELAGARGMKYYQDNPLDLNDPKFKLDVDKLGLKGAEKDSFLRLTNDMTRWDVDYDDMVRNSIARGDKTAFTRAEALKIHAMAVGEIALRSSLSTTSAAWQNNALAKVCAPLLRWSFNRMVQVEHLVLNTEGKRSMQALTRGLAGLSIAAGGGLAVQALLDQYYMNLLGKQRNISPVLQAPNAQQFVAGVMEDLNRTGTFGLFGELANNLTGLDQGGDNRVLSVDQRVLAVSAIQGILQAADSWYNQGFNIDYSHVIRPLAGATGLNGLIQYVQLANHTLGLDNAESRVTARINATNYLRVVGRELGMDVRVQTGGSSNPTPITPYLTRMELAAYGNSPGDFHEAYADAVASAKEQGHEDPVEYVKRAFATRNPLRTVFAVTPSNADYQKLLVNMPGTGREDVEQAVRLFNEYSESIGAKPFEGTEPKVTPVNFKGLPSIPSLQSFRDRAAALQ